MTAIDTNTNSLVDMTKAQLQEMAQEFQIKFNTKTTKGQLVEKIESAQAEQIKEIEAFANESKKTRSYIVRAPGTIVYTTKARSTGAQTEVMKMGMRGEWSVECLTHGGEDYPETREVAENMATHPENFCSDCQEIFEAKGN